MAWELVGNIKGPQGEKGDAGDDATVVVDAALSGDSENPVQNKVIKTALDTKADSEHTHTVSEITDFPESMPASDVSAWAKASTKPTYTASEVGAAEEDHIHTDATTSVAGFMSAADKTKLDGIATGATATTKTSDLTNDSEFQTATQVQTSINQAVSSMYKVKGSCTRGELPGESSVGDVWNLTDENGMNVVWTGTEWDNLGSQVVLTWDAIQSKPSTFTPSAHTHAISEVTDLQTTLDGKAAAEHTHDISDVTGLQTALDGKAASTHTHTDATTDAAGFMSATDKTKLDGIEAGANNFSLPEDGTSGQYLRLDGGHDPYWSDPPDIDRPTGDKFGGIKLGDVDGHENAFYLDSAGNLNMRITDPLKFTSLGSLYLSYGGGLTRSEDGILQIERPVPGGGEIGQVLTKTSSPATSEFTWQTLDIPDPITVDSSMSDSSTNPVQNKVVTNHIETVVNDFTDLLATKADSTHTHTGYATTDQLETLTTDFTDALNTKLSKEDIASVYRYKGSVANQSALPSTENTVGDVYNVEDTGMNYAWDGTQWDALGSAGSLVDLGVTATAAELNYMSGVTSSVQTQIDGLKTVASTSANGLMSSADKTKLDGITFASDEDFKVYMGIS